MKNIKSNKGITNATILIIVLIIIVLMLLAAVIYLVKNQNTTYITQNVPTGQQKVNSSNVEEERLTPSTEIKTEKVEMTSEEKHKIFVQNLKEGIANLEENTTVGGNYNMPYDNLGSYSLGLAGFETYKKGVQTSLMPLYLRKSQAERALEEKSKKE